jgi:serine/threonine protein kinase
MTASKPDNESIFHAARDIADPERRRAYLRSACGGDETRIAHLEAQLAAGDAPDSLLDHPAVGPATVDVTETAPTARVEMDPPIDFLALSDMPGSLGRLGHYEVKELIGRGGMGVVLKAFDENLHRVVAVKVMVAQLATSAAARRRFIREARAAAAVSHDHVVTIYAVEEDDRLPYLVMQYVDGTSLQERLDRSGPLPLAEILRIGMQTASGLAAAHAQGLVHRDVKPANILLENGVERVKLTDFGLARAADDASLTLPPTENEPTVTITPSPTRAALDADSLEPGTVLC